MAYINGFEIAAPAARRQEVVDYAARFDPLFLEVGATRVVEAWGDDVPHGKLTDFHRDTPRAASNSGNTRAKPASTSSARRCAAPRRANAPGRPSSARRPVRRTTRWSVAG